MVLRAGMKNQFFVHEQLMYCIYNFTHSAYITQSPVSNIFNLLKHLKRLFVFITVDWEIIASSDFRVNAL